MFNSDLAKPNNKLASRSIEGETRMKPINAEQAVKLYGRGFKLLKKSGLKEDQGLVAPVKVYVRRVREGLKDNDTDGRRVLGEEATQAKPSTTIDQVDVSEYTGEYHNVLDYLARSGGSCSIQSVFRDVIQRRIPKASLIVFKLVLDTVSSEEQFRRVGQELVLRRAPRVQINYIACVCSPLRIWSTVGSWADHVLNHLYDKHESYVHRLAYFSTLTANLMCCLVCFQSAPDLARLIEHCRTSENKDHVVFAKVILICLLQETSKNDNMQTSMLLEALSSCDRDFPWKYFVGGAIDALEAIPFTDVPGTPIDLSDEDVSENVCEVVEIDLDDKMSSEIVTIDDD